MVVFLVTMKILLDGCLDSRHICFLKKTLQISISIVESDGMSLVDAIVEERKDE